MFNYTITLSKTEEYTVFNAKHFGSLVYRQGDETVTFGSIKKKMIDHMVLSLIETMPETTNPFGDVYTVTISFVLGIPVMLYCVRQNLL